MISDICKQVDNPSRGNNVQFKKCSPATSAGAQARTTRGGEVTVSDFVARRLSRTQWFGSIARRRSTGAHLVGDRTQARKHPFTQSSTRDSDGRPTLEPWLNRVIAGGRE